MNWHKSYKDEWIKTIEAISTIENKSVVLIEKDIIQSMFLYKLANSNPSFVFKGGTSLSKAFQTINRFSEDLDISMSNKPTDSEKRKTKETILSIASELGLELINPDMIKSRFDFNRYVFRYESLFDEDELELIVETSFYQVSYPVEKKTIHSYVGDYCISNNIKLPFPFIYEFEMNVQTIERTFIDKVFAVCDYRIENMEERDSRHLYDIAKIIPLVKIDESLDKLIDDVRDDRMMSKNNPSANLMYNINSMLKEIIDSRFYERDYKTITSKLLYENYSYEDAIKEGIYKLLDTDVFNYKKIRAHI